MSLLDKHKSNLVQSTKQSGSNSSEAKAAEEVPPFDALTIAAQDYARATRTPIDPKPRGAADQKDAAQALAK